MSATPAGSVALAPTDWASRVRVGSVGILPALFVAQFVFGVVRRSFDDADLVLQLGVATAAALGVVVLVVYLNSRRRPVPVADFSSARLIVGATSMAFSEIDDARYTPTQVKWGRQKGVLRIGRRATPEARAVTAIIPLPFLDLSAADALRQAALLVVLDASNIRLPTDPYDPTGRFAMISAPDGHVDKAAAIAVVENPEEEIAP